MIACLRVCLFHLFCLIVRSHVYLCVCLFGRAIVCLFAGWFVCLFARVVVCCLWFVVGVTVTVVVLVVVAGVAAGVGIVAIAFYCC